MHDAGKLKENVVLLALYPFWSVTRGLRLSSPLTLRRGQSWGVGHAKVTAALVASQWQHRA